MDFFSLLIGVAASVIAVLLGLLTLGGRITRWLKAITRDVLLETGLIRYSRIEDPGTLWPNGWDNLPEALEGIAQRVDDHIAAHATGSRSDAV
jgi:hypothetical protein